MLKKTKRPQLACCLSDAEKPQAGVFVIRNTLDSRVYIGATKHLHCAYRQTHHDLRAGQHSSDRLQAFAAAHGLQVLRFEALECCPVAELPAAKQRHLDQLQACAPAHGFNSLNPAGPTGRKMSSEARARLSAGKRGKTITPRTPEHQQKLTAAHQGRKRSPETCAAISAATRGKPKRRRQQTPEQPQPP